MTEIKTPTPRDAYDLLLAGNQRFAAGTAEHPRQDAARRAETTSSQHPFAVVFACSDSRLPAENIFDCGLGDLFVVRTAGHVMGPEVLGSIEYGVDLLDCPLLVVLGHDSCGGVGAACATLDNGTVPAGYIRDVVERVTPSVLAARAAGRVKPEELIEEHVRNTAELLLGRSRGLAEKVAAGRTALVGLRYGLSDGRAHFVVSHGLDDKAPAAS
jgi:carbonic anhydrase